MSRRRKQQRGLLLMEALVALLISSVVLVGLAVGQLKSLQYANNSFQYTLALIQANNVVERVWSDVCEIQHGVKEFDQAYIDNTLAPSLVGYKMKLEGAEANAFSDNFTVNISWEDARVNNENISINDNQINVIAAFPKLPSRCYAI